MEHHVDIPVPGGGGRLAGLQDSLPGQSSTASHLSLERISERIAEQIVEFPGGGLQGLRPRQGSTASSSFHSSAGSDDDADEPSKGVFRTVPHPKKSARVTPHLGSELGADSSSSELSAHHTPLRLAMPLAMRGCVWTRCMARTGGTWTCSTPSGIRPGEE